MGLGNLFSERKILTLVSMIIITVGLLAEFIVSIYWWSKMHPWFSHAIKDGKTVYQSITACWVLSLVGLIAIVILLIFTLFVPSICDSITGNIIILIVCIAAVGALSIGSIISGAYGSSFAVKSPKECKTPDDFDLDTWEEFEKCESDFWKNKCIKYINSGMIGIEKWLADGHDNKVKDYEKWWNDMGDKYYQKYCGDVGIPTLVFALVQAVGIIFFIVVLILAVTGFSKVG